MIQASCQARHSEKCRKMNGLLTPRQTVAGLLRTRILRIAHSLCAAQILCSRLSKRPPSGQKPDQGTHHPFEIAYVSYRAPAARDLHFHWRQRRLRLAALLQPLAAANRKLNCFAALLGSVVVTRFPRLPDLHSPRARQSCPHGSRRSAALSLGACRSHLRSKRNH